jgi:hypothetical protein
MTAARLIASPSLWAPRGRLRPTSVCTTTCSWLTDCLFACRHLKSTWNLGTGEKMFSSSQQLKKTVPKKKQLKKTLTFLVAVYSEIAIAVHVPDRDNSPFVPKMPSTNSVKKKCPPQIQILGLLSTVKTPKFTFALSAAPCSTYQPMVSILSAYYWGAPSLDFGPLRAHARVRMLLPSPTAGLACMVPPAMC